MRPAQHAAPLTAKRAFPAAQAPKAAWGEPQAEWQGKQDMTFSMYAYTGVGERGVQQGMRKQKYRALRRTVDLQEA